MWRKNDKIILIKENKSERNNTRGKKILKWIKWFNHTHTYWDTYTKKFYANLFDSHIEWKKKNNYNDNIEIKQQK